MSKIILDFVIPRVVEDGTSNVAFRSAKVRCFRGAKGDIDNRDRYRQPEMWQTQTDLLDDGRVQRFAISHNARILTFADVISLWRGETAFRSYFTTLLADAPFDAYRWETPGVTLAILARDFEFVLLRSDSLARAVDESGVA